MSLLHSIVVRFILILAIIFITVLSDSITDNTVVPETDDCELHTTLDELRDNLGSNQYSLIQGLNARQSRLLYHKLLPKCILTAKYDKLSICEKANKAFLARKAAKRYIRERSNILVSSFAKTMDLWRHGNINGATDIFMWNRKAMKINEMQCVVDNEDDNLLWNDEKCENVCKQILMSSTKTNVFVDKMAGIQDKNAISSSDDKQSTNSPSNYDDRVKSHNGL